MLTSPESAPTTTKTRVLIVDDHVVVRFGIAARLGIEPDLEVCGEAATAAEALKLVVAQQPDVVLLDLSLAGGSGLDLIKELQLRGSPTRILVVSAQDEALYAERCVRAGAFGYLSKQEAVDKIVTAIRRVRNGDYCLSDAVSAQILARLGTRGRTTPPLTTLGSLSDRELQVYEAIGAGLSIKEIATKLALNPKTVDSYRAKLKQKLGLQSSQQLGRHALHWALEQARGS